MLRRVVGVDLPQGFAVIVLTTLMPVLSITILAPALPLLTAEFELSGAAAALLLTANAAGRLVMTMPGGALTDRFGYGATAIGALMVAAAAAAVATAVPTFPVLLAVQIVQGLAGGAMVTASFAAIVALSGPGTVGRVVSTFQGGVVTSMTLSPAVGGAAAGMGGVTGPFWVLLALELVALVVLVVSLQMGVVPWRPTARHEGRSRDRWRAVGTVARSRAFVLSFVAAVTLGWSIAGTRNTLVPLFAADAFGFDSAATGGVLTILAAAGVPPLLLAGRALDRYGRRPVTRVGTVLAALSTAALALSIAPWMLVVLGLVHSFAIGAIAPSQPAVVSDLAPPETLGTALGVARMATPLGFTLGPVMAGWFVDASDARTAFLIAAAMIAVLAVLCQRMPETMQPAAPDPSSGPETSPHHG